MAKTFSYREITQKAEQRIVRLMENASKETGEIGKRLYQDWAYGVFLGWKDLVMGHCEGNDLERLEGLTRPKKVEGV